MAVHHALIQPSKSVTAIPAASMFKNTRAMTVCKSSATSMLDSEGSVKRDRSAFGRYEHAIERERVEMCARWRGPLAPQM